MRHTYVTAAILGLVLHAASTGMANATVVEMQGNYVYTAVGDNGTLGAGSATPPGIRHDATGSGNFTTGDGALDYLTPGNPWEIFAIAADGALYVNNNNAPAGGAITIGQTTVDLSASMPFDNYVRWTGSNSDFNVTHDYFFNDGDEFISIATTIEALDNFSDVSFLRAIDPDPDNYSGGSAATHNVRGLDLNSDADYLDPGEIPPEQFVGSEGTISGLTLALYTSESGQTNPNVVTTNTGISWGWDTSPAAYLSGGDTSMDTSDSTIGVAFALGGMTALDTLTVTYSYVMGDTFQTVDIPDDEDHVPEPATMALLGFGLLGMGWMRRRKA